MKVWHFILSKLKEGQSVVLLYVIDNSGSSPGRKGFKMAVAKDGQFIGTIGGGIMEVKLLELAKNKLKKNDAAILIKRQFHDKKHIKNQSGLICSGEQTVALIPLSQKDQNSIQTIVDQHEKGIKIGLSDEHFVLIDDDSKKEQFQAIISLNPQRRVHVFGGGHVGFALTQVLSLLEYNILLYDNRPNLVGLKENTSADEIHVIDYEKVNDYCTFKKDDSVVIVTSSYRSDKLVLKQLYQKKISYIGMMGSDAKLAKLYDDLANEGISKADLAHVMAPIGIQVLSKTAMEIAVSIAGEMILEANRALPSGRSLK